MIQLRSNVSKFILCGFMLFPAEMHAAAAQKPAYFHVVTVADGAQFVLRLNDAKLIRQARDIVSGKERQKVHVSALVVKAPAVYNTGWSFHLDTNSVEFFSVSTEVCDAATVLVERNLGDVGGAFLPGSRWCPWSSVVVAELQTPKVPVLSVVSAASLSELAVSPTSLASVLGTNLTTQSESAQGDTLPTKLGGIEVEFRRAGNTQRWKAPLLMVSPERINFVVPENLRSETYTVRLIRDGASALESATRVENVAPGIFYGETAEGRVAAATLLRVRADGSRSEEAVLGIDESGAMVAVPVDFGAADDRLYLSLYGTGIGTKPVKVRVGSESVDAMYSGPQRSIPGLDQVNVELPRSLASQSSADVTVSAKNEDGHTLQSLPVMLTIKRK